MPSKAPSAAQSPAFVSQTPTLSPATKRHHKEFEVGHRVRILDSGLHHGEDGEVVAASFSSVENDYRIALDKESHFHLWSYCYRPAFPKIPYPDEAVAVSSPGSAYAIYLDKVVAVLSPRSEDAPS